MVCVMYMNMNYSREKTTILVSTMVDLDVLNEDLSIIHMRQQLNYLSMTLTPELKLLVNKLSFS